MRKLDYLPVVALAAALPLGLLIGCGSSGGNNLSPIPPPPSSSGANARTFSGQIPLGTGQTGNLVVTRTAGGAVSGVLTINNGSGTPETVDLLPVSGGTAGSVVLGGSLLQNGTSVPVTVTVTGGPAVGGSGSTSNVNVRLGANEFGGTIQPSTSSPTPTPTGTPIGSPTPTPTPTPTATPTPNGSGTLNDFIGSVPGTNNSYTFTETTTTSTTINGQTTTNTNTVDVTNSGSDFNDNANVGASTQVQLDGTGPLVTRQEQLNDNKQVVGYNYFTKDANGYTSYGTDTVDPTTGTVTEKTRFSPAITFPFNLRPGQSVGPTAVTVTVTNLVTNTTNTANYTYKFTYVANETVTVPAGTFSNAAHTRTEISYSTTNSGITINFTSTTDTWFAKNVGTVKSHHDSQSTSSGGPVSSSSHTVEDSVLKSATVNGNHIP
jgi:hypothetical protein